MMDTLRLSLVQCDLHWENCTQNLAAFDVLLTTIEEPTDLIILPEMFTTGFSMKAAALAEPMEGKSMQWMAQQAEKRKAAVVGSLIIEENKNYYNRLIWMLPDGNYYQYDKRHLFGMAKENETYQAGVERLIVDWRGWRFCPLVCYDLRFPVWSRNTYNYDVLLYIANWPINRSFHWKALLLARAIENQAFTIGVNRIGTDGKGYYYGGDSSVISPRGECLFHAHDRAVVHTQVLKKEELNACRKQLPFLRDRDDFEIVGEKSVSDLN